MDTTTSMTSTSSATAATGVNLDIAITGASALETTQPPQPRDIPQPVLPIPTPNII